MENACSYAFASKLPKTRGNAWCDVCIARFYRTADSMLHLCVGPLLCGIFGSFEYPAEICCFDTNVQYTAHTNNAHLSVRKKLASFTRLSLHRQPEHRRKCVRTWTTSTRNMLRNKRFTPLCTVSFNCSVCCTSHHTIFRRSQQKALSGAYCRMLGN